jgi:hypothetical protein
VIRTVDEAGERAELGTGFVDVYWLPLGAGGRFVRLNGRAYEAIQAYRERRKALDLYHSAMEVHVPEGRYTIEMAWPIPSGDPNARGVVLQGPVGSRAAARFRAMRYEVRRWREGVIPDIGEAVASPVRLKVDEPVARQLLDQVVSVPPLIWGRDELRTGEMWNSNSVIAWLLARAGIDAGTIQPPPRGRAPGWRAGLVVAALSGMKTPGDSMP